MNQIKNNIDRYLGIITAVLLVLSCGPFFVIGGISTIVNVLVFCGFLTLYMTVISKSMALTDWNISRSNYNILVGSLVFFILIFVPFRPYDTVVAVTIWGLTFFLFLFLRDGYVELVGNIFSYFLFYVTFFVIINWVLLFLGVALPYWEYSTGLIGVSKSTFLVYPGTAVLDRQDFEFFGRKVYRMSGIFSEPGHYGIFCFFAYLMGAGLSKFKRNTILLGSILSFSMGTYVLWIGYLIIANRFTLKHATYLVLIILFILGVGYLYLPTEFLDRFIFSKIGSDSSLDDRTDINFIAFFNSEHTLVRRVLGYGRLLFEEYNLSNSDYRGYYLKYGVIGFFAFVTWVIVLAFNGKRKNNWLIFFIALVILAHRSWLIDYFILYFILYYITKSDKL